MSKDHRNREQVVLAGPYSAFNELMVTQIHPIVQLDALYGMRTQTDTEIFESEGGTASINDTTTGREFICTSGGTTTTSYGVIRSQRAVRYQGGIGQLVRISARFSTPQTQTGMRTGFFTTGNELSFGYDGSQFGILHKSGGRLEMRNLVFTTVPGATQTATIIVNGSTFTAQLNTAATLTVAAVDLAGNSFSGWGMSSNNDTVLFQNQVLGANIGTFSFTTTGDAVAAFSSLASGNAAVETWVYQSDWNRDTMDGSEGGKNMSKITLDPTKGNIYGIQYQYLGFGVMNFFIDRPDSDLPILVHTIENPNSLTRINIAVPIFKVGWFAFNAGVAGNIFICGGSALGATEGIQGNETTRNPRAASTTVNVGTTLTPILSIRNRKEFDSVINLTEIMLDDFEVSCDGTKVTEASLIIGATLTNPQWQYTDQTNSTAETDTLATAISGGDTILKFSLGKADSRSKNLIPLKIKLLPNKTVTVAVKASGATSDFGTNITWSEI